MIATSCASALNSLPFQRQVNALRRLDNWTNWLYLACEYLYLGVVIGLTLLFYHNRVAWGLAWAWNIPVTLAAVALVGVGQHRLAMLGHEGSHYSLFRSRWLNEAASNWLCFFPLLSMTHNYRLIHMAHHQFVNDPQRDPDFRFMRVAGHRFHHPMSRSRFLWDCVVRLLLWAPGLVKYILIRAQATALGEAEGPYKPKQKPSRLVMRLELLYLLSLIAGLTFLGRRGEVWLFLAPAALLPAALLFTLLAPERLYLQSPVKPIGPLRWWAFQRLVYLTLLFTALSWLTVRTGEPWWLYYALLWLTPIGTTFSFLMMLREEVQHSNAGQERFRHSRLFAGNPLMRWAVFPLGMDCHLPHHLFPMVPHYRLHRLHTLLRETDPYRDEAVVVPGYFLGSGDTHPAPSRSSP
jgi:fatty acid desaturase